MEKLPSIFSWHLLACLADFPRAWWIDSHFRRFIWSHSWTNIIILIILVGYLLWPSVVVFFLFIFSFVYAGIVEERKKHAFVTVGFVRMVCSYFWLQTKLQMNYYKYRNIENVGIFLNIKIRFFGHFVSSLLLIFWRLWITI